MSHLETTRWGDPVDPETFKRVGDEVDRLYTNAMYQEAYDLMEVSWPGLPNTVIHPSKQDCLQFKAYLLAQLGETEAVLEAIQAGHRCKISWGLGWELFNPIRELDGYGDLEKANAALIEAEKADAVRKMTVRFPEDHHAGSTAPLCLILHGDGGSMEKVAGFWPADPMLARGFIVAYVQSSQLVFSNRFAWLPDPQVAWEDVKTTYCELKERYSIDEEKVLICGFSGGAITTVDLVFGDAIPAAGFICLCPEFKPAHFTPDAVISAKERGVRGVFLEGAVVWPLEDEKEMMDAMQASDFPIKLILNEGIGHAAPPDFINKLEQALDFTVGR